VSDDERESGARAAERLTFFSDAVVAIAITLLAIDLPVPEGSTLHGFWMSVRNDDGHYAAFLISFLVIAAAWFDHHDLFRYVLRWGFYALLQVLESGMVYAMLRHMIARGLADPPRPVVASMTWKYASVILGFGLSIPVFFVVTEGWLLWALGPVLAGLLRRRRHRSHRHLEDARTGPG
jgi:hypothetical protein